MTTDGIELRPVDIGNYYEIIMLEPAPDQARYLWSNGAQLAEAAYVPDITAEAIYCDGAPAGLVCWGPYHPDFRFREPPEPGTWCLEHLMVAAPFQRRGIGRRVFEMVLGRMRALPDCRRVVISVSRDNAIALRLYESHGFRRCGIDAEGDPLLELALRAS